MKWIVITICGVMLVPVYAGSALAQCVPGAPCLTSDYTPGDSNNDPKALDSDACDGDFMNQIYARAFVEAERENIMNRTYIKKADSTLEYSCFHSYLNSTAQFAPPLFSENTEWDGTMIPLNIASAPAGNPDEIPIRVNMGSGHITPNMTAVVSRSLGEFVNTNWNHNAYGGTAGPLTVSGTTSPGAYTCGNMALIYEIARCENFPPAADTFWTFEELAAGDPRLLTPACTGAITTEMITTANNAGPLFPTAEFDEIDIFMARVMPANSTAECLPPIQTGLQVIQYDYAVGASIPSNPSGITRTDNVIPESVCINPACYYDAAANTCVRG